MTFSRTKRFIVALLAQVTLCLAFAPVIASAKPASQESSRSDTPARGSSTIQAFDAANVRPEDASDVEKNSGKARGSIDRLAKRQGRNAPAGASKTVAAASVDRESTAGQTIGSGFFGGKKKAENQDAGGFATLSDSSSFPFNHQLLKVRQQERMPAAPIIGDCIQPTGPPISA